MVAFNEEEIERSKAVYSIVSKYSSLPISSGIKQLEAELLVTTTQLSDLINSRYQDFISLPDGLTGMDQVVNDLRLQSISQIENDTLFGVGEQVVQELDARVNKLESQIERNAKLLSKRQTLQKDIKMLSHLLQLDEGRKRLVDLFDSTKKSNYHFTQNDNGTSKVPLSTLSSVVVDIEKVSRELIYLEGNLNSPLSIGSSPFMLDIRKSIEGLRVALIDSVKTLLLKAMDVVLVDQSSTLDISLQLASLIRICQELDCLATILDVFETCIIKPFLLDMTIQKSNGAAFDECLKSIISFTKEKCRPIYSVSLQSEKSSYSQSSTSLIVNGVWNRTVSWIMKEFENNFLVGPSLSKFHDDYTAFNRFVQDFESICIEMGVLGLLRESEVYLESQKKWQLSVYFQLTHNEIVQEFESSFHIQPPASTASVSVIPSISPHKAVIKAIERFWASQVAIKLLVPRLFKSTLLVIHRYASWARSSIPVSVESAISTMTPPPLNDVQDLCTKYSDLLSCTKKIIIILKERIPMVVGSSSSDDRMWTLLDAALEDAFERKNGQEKMHGMIIGALVCLSCDILSASNNIPAQYRRTGKEIPTSPSYFIQSCFDKVTSLLSESPSLDPQLKADIQKQIALRVMEHYTSLVIKVLEGVKSMEESLKKFKKIRGGRSTTKTNVEETSDEDKIRLQFKIDSEAFGKLVVALGVDQDCEESNLKKFRTSIDDSTATNNDDA